MRYGRSRSAATTCKLLTGAEGNLELETKQCPQWLVGNAGGMGYYRVDYDQKLQDRALFGSRSAGRGAGIFQAAVFLPSLVPLVAAAVIWRWLFNGELGLVNRAVEAVTWIRGPNWLGHGPSAMAALIVMETVADNQQWVFQTTKRRRQAAGEPVDKGFLDKGLWAWSRHPNYCGEILLWIGIALVAAPALSGWSSARRSSPWRSGSSSYRTGRRARAACSAGRPSCTSPSP